MTTIQTFNNGESGNSIRSKINTSLTNLNNDKAENSTVEVLETQINTKVTNIYGGSNVSVNRVGNDVYVSSTGGGGGSGNDGAFAYYSTTATQGQTIFNIGFTYTNGNNNLFVFVNGLKMQVGNDYTESSSTSITFNYGLNAGDIVQVIYPNKGLNWKGTYSNITAYAKDDAVYYDGSSYICIANTTGNLPTNITYWNVLAQKGNKGDNGDIIGPTSSSNENIVVFDGVTGKLIKDGGKKISELQPAGNYAIGGGTATGNNTGDQTITTGTITATEGQTAVTVGTHIVNSTKLIITLNGLEQTLGTDYTDTGVTQITFTSGLLAGDKVKYKILS